MSNDSNPDLELKLEVRRPFPDREVDGPSPSPPRSCVSVELELDGLEFHRLGNNPDAKGVSMVLAGCQRCLMYVMLWGDRLRCPKCESTAVLLIDVMKDHAAKGTAGSRMSRDD